MGVSRDDQWVVTAAGELKAYEVEAGIVRTIEGHSGYIDTIDISTDSKYCRLGGFERSNPETV